MKKSHRVAHENQRRGGFCYYHYTTFIATVKIPFLKKEYKLPLFLAVHTYYMQCNRYVLRCQLSINQFVQHNFFCTIVDAAHSLNPFLKGTFFIPYHMVLQQHLQLSVYPHIPGTTDLPISHCTIQRMIICKYSDHLIQ